MSVAVSTDDAAAVGLLELHPMVIGIYWSQVESHILHRTFFNWPVPECRLHRRGYQLNTIWRTT